MKNKLVAIIICSMLFAMPAAADSLEERVAALEETVKELQAEVAELKGSAPQVSTESASVSVEQAEVGDGNVWLVNSSGSTENGDPIIIYGSGNPMDLEQIGFSSRDVNGALLSYIYIDGVLNDTMQLGDTDASLMITGEDYAIGSHLVEVKQYEDNNEDGTVVFYRSAKYEVKEK